MKQTELKKCFQWFRPFWRHGKATVVLLGLALMIHLLAGGNSPKAASADNLQEQDMHLSDDDLNAVAESNESLVILDISPQEHARLTLPEISSSAAFHSKKMIQRISAEETEAIGPPAMCASWLIGLIGFRFKNPKKERNKMKDRNSVGSTMKKASSSAKGWLAALALLVGATPMLAAPANDNLASATVISSGFPISVAGSNVGATAEAGEPSHSDSEARGGRSVWWSWTPTVSGLVTITTENSGTTDGGVDPYVDTQVGVYTGNSIAGLVPVAKKEDSDGAFAHGWTRLTVNVTAGTPYKIAVDGWNGATGRIQLNIFEGDVNQPPSEVPPKYVLNLEVVPAGAGAISVDPAQPDGGYDAGTIVTLTVGANSGNTFSTWSGAASGTSSSVQVTMNGPKTVKAIFNSDHQILFENPNRVMAAWFMQSTNYLGGATLRDGQVSGPGWKAVAVGDFDNDGSKDILWQNSDGRLAVWLMDGTNFKSATLLRNGLAAGPGWRAAGFADFDGGGADVLFQHENGRVAIWRFNNMAFVGGGIVEGNTIGAGWKVIGAPDMNGDNQPDIVFQHLDGRVGVWLLNGTTFTSGVLLRNGQVGGPGWRVAAFADLNNDGSTDLIWQNDNGRMAVWNMDGTTFISSGVLRSGGIGWRVVGAN